jgi:hypothetical protein
MRWRRRRELRRAQEREQQLQLLLLMEQLPLLVRQETRAALLEALAPLAQALQRQDSLLLARTQPLEEMLLELLQAQPTPASRLRQELGISQT